jgi:short-subunit dehydrogenase involved in D-alanine esterification of teichoic acids
VPEPPAERLIEDELEEALSTYGDGIAYNATARVQLIQQAIKELHKLRQHASVVEIISGMRYTIRQIRYLVDTRISTTAEVNAYLDSLDSDCDRIVAAAEATP